ncbi:hypothetical protein GC197_10085 [bacterium]|nr:hypothetical protein [bacterium]
MLTLIMLRASRSIVLSLSVLFSVCLVCGCGATSGIPVEAVSGTVTLNGQPIESALVIFKPQSDGRTASGYTLADGSFQLSTSGASRSGAMIGNYDVLISKKIEVDSHGKPIQFDSNEVYDPNPKPQKRGKMVSQIPDRYNDPSEPLLTANVQDGSNHFEFKLEK